MREEGSTSARREGFLRSFPHAPAGAAHHQGLANARPPGSGGGTRLARAPEGGLVRRAAEARLEGLVEDLAERRVGVDQCSKVWNLIRFP